MEKKFEYLIFDYLQKIKIGMNYFYKVTDNIYPIKAWRKNTISRKGQINSDFSYELHGVGCTFLIKGEFLVDFDFYGDGFFDAFDLWRLKEFVRNTDNIVLKELYRDLDVLDEDFQNAIRNNQLEKISNTNLYRLSDSI